MTNKFNNQIYYYICDFLYVEYKATNYLTFNNMCKTLLTKIDSNVQLTTSENRVIYNTTNNLYRTFNFSDEEITDYIYTFLSKELWLKFDSIVVNLRTDFGSSIY